MSDFKDLYWDSCVFYRFLTGYPTDYVDDVVRLVGDAKKGERKIYTSTIVLAEIRGFALKKTNFSSVREFFDDLRKGVSLIDPNPNIMIFAGQLKDNEATNPSGDGAAPKRVIGTADAIHLATCLFLRDSMGVKDIVFHTFDDGKGKTWEGKCVPLLSFERWFPEQARSKPIESVCGLTRIRPLHPVPTLFSPQVPHGSSAHTH